MSFRAIAWAWEQTTGSPGRKAVLMAVAQFADEHGTCWPSQGYIAKYTEQSPRTVREHLAALEADGYLVRRARTNSDGKITSDMTTLQFQRQISPAAIFAVGEKQQEPAANFATNTVIEPISKKKERAPAKGVTFDFETGLFHGIDRDLFGRLEAAYPATAVSAEILKAALWLCANPANRKSNYTRFITGWLSRAQDRARPVASSGATYGNHQRPATTGERRDQWTEAMFGDIRRARNGGGPPADDANVIDLPH